MNIAGKVALVTGASRGIGKAISLALARAGANVACLATTASNASTTADAVSELGRSSLALGCRVEESAQVNGAFEQVRKELGPVQILVNNAGLSKPKPILDMTEADWDLHLDVNAKSVFLCSKLAARHMVDTGKGGCIINIGSMAGENAFPLRLGYCTSKAAMHHMTRVMAIEWAELGIRVNAIAPGYIRTELVEGLGSQGILDTHALERRTPQRRLGTVEEIADAAIFLASDSASFITGSVLTVDGGWSAYGYV